MRTITIQKIAYDKFEVIIHCRKCKEKSRYIINSLPTKFPYPIKQILDKFICFRTYCPKCKQLFKFGNIDNIIFNDLDNVKNTISYNVFKRKLTIKNKFITCSIKTKYKNTYPIIINKISNKNGDKITNYQIKDEFVNFVFYGWIESFHDVRKCLNGYIPELPFELAPKKELNTIKIKSPATKQKDNTDVKFSVINKTDVLVISDLRRCVNQNHCVEDVVAVIYTVINECKQKQYINASFCSECCRYTISESEFNNIKGKPICQIKWYDKTSDLNINNTDTWDFNTQHSILYNLGYNVQRNNNLTPGTRRQILINAIQSHKLSKGQVCSYLETFINQKRNQPNMQEAVSKWKSDLQYIYNIKINTDKEQIHIKSITKK